MMVCVWEEILESQDSRSLVLFLSLPFPSSDTAHLFSCAVWQIGMGSNMVLKTVQSWTRCLNPEKHPSFPETGPFSKKKFKNISKADAKSVTEFDEVHITPAPYL